MPWVDLLLNPPPFLPHPTSFSRMVEEKQKAEEKEREAEQAAKKETVEAGLAQAAGPEPGPVADQKLPAAPERATHSSQSPKKPFNSIIEHLLVVFPCYSRYESKMSAALLNALLN